MQPTEALLAELSNPRSRLIVDRRRSRLEKILQGSDWQIESLEFLHHAKKEGAEAQIFVALIKPTRDDVDEWSSAPIPKSLYTKVLDKFYVPKMSDVDVSAAFFDTIAPIYNGLIDAKFNISIAAELLAHVVANRFGKSHPLLDFGCGTGLVVQALAKAQLSQTDVVGTDVSPAMLEMAQKNGLRTVAFDEWRGLTGFQWNGAISTFVLHYGIPLEDLRRLYNQLTPRSRFAANYFKASPADVEQISAQIESVGFILQKVIQPNTKMNSPNPLLIFSKVPTQ